MKCVICNKREQQACNQTCNNNNCILTYDIQIKQKLIKNLKEQIQNKEIYLKEQIQKITQSYKDKENKIELLKKEIIDLENKFEIEKI